ncbi:hypothetical protein G9A89_009015 [Geosiphon pyriformis]|nr:hypothetical protein G9A89_009015 [Geosiphon pyriformis]
MFDLWSHQYMPLDYVDGTAFFNIMELVNISELSSVISNLPNDKSADLSGIPNKLWKHCDKEAFGQKRESDGLENILAVEKVGSEGTYTLLVHFEAESTNAPNLKVLSVLESEAFSEVCCSLLEVWFSCIEVYTDESLKNAGSAKMVSGVAAYFPAANISVGIKVHGLLSSTLTELQAIVLVLECVLFSCTVILYLDS